MPRARSRNVESIHVRNFHIVDLDNSISISEEVVADPSYSGMIQTFNGLKLTKDQLLENIRRCSMKMVHYCLPMAIYLLSCSSAGQWRPLVDIEEHKFAFFMSIFNTILLCYSSEDTHLKRSNIRVLPSAVDYVEEMKKDIFLHLNYAGQLIFVMNPGFILRSIDFMESGRLDIIPNVRCKEDLRILMAQPIQLYSNSFTSSAFLLLEIQKFNRHKHSMSYFKRKLRINLDDLTNENLITFIRRYSLINNYGSYPGEEDEILLQDFMKGTQVMCIGTIFQKVYMKKMIEDFLLRVNTEIIKRVQEMKSVPDNSHHFTNFRLKRVNRAILDCWGIFLKCNGGKMSELCVNRLWVEGNRIEINAGMMWEKIDQPLDEFSDDVSLHCLIDGLIFKRSVFKSSNMSDVMKKMFSFLFFGSDTQSMVAAVLFHKYYTDCRGVQRDLFEKLMETYSFLRCNIKIFDYSLAVKEACKLLQFVVYLHKHDNFISRIRFITLRARLDGICDKVNFLMQCHRSPYYWVKASTHRICALLGMLTLSLFPSKTVMTEQQISSQISQGLNITGMFQLFSTQIFQSMMTSSEGDWGRYEYHITPGMIQSWKNEIISCSREFFLDFEISSFNIKLPATGLQIAFTNITYPSRKWEAIRAKLLARPQLLETKEIIVNICRFNYDRKILVIQEDLYRPQLLNDYRECMKLLYNRDIEIRKQLKSFCAEHRHLKYPVPQRFQYRFKLHPRIVIGKNIIEKWERIIGRILDSFLINEFCVGLIVD
jgi:hypothetical protein